MLIMSPELTLGVSGLKGVLFGGLGVFLTTFGTPLGVAVRGGRGAEIFGVTTLLGVLLFEGEA